MVRLFFCFGENNPFKLGSLNLRITLYYLSINLGVYGEIYEKKLFILNLFRFNPVIRIHHFYFQVKFTLLPLA